MPPCAISGTGGRETGPLKEINKSLVEEVGGTVSIDITMFLHLFNIVFDGLCHFGKSGTH